MTFCPEGTSSAFDMGWDVFQEAELKVTLGAPHLEIRTPQKALATKTAAQPWLTC